MWSMKKYTSRAVRWLFLLTLINALALLIGIVLIAVSFSNVGLQVVLTMLGGFLTILFLCCFLTEKSRWLTIDPHQIVLPRGADHDGKMIFKRTIIKTGDIVSVESNLYKGNGLISKDTYFHTLKLKDSTKVTFTLYAYGKDAEKEIIKTIKNSI